MTPKPAVLLTLLAMSVVLGCNAGSSRPNDVADGTVWGGPVDDELLRPFQGQWQFETGEIEGGDASTATPIASLPDLTIAGHVIRFGTFPSEIRLFALHEHDGRLCGKGWHHEDVNDPGDMSKQHVTLEIEGDKLLMRVQHSSRAVDMNDRDSGAATKVIAAANSPCPLESDIDYEWNPWEAHAYERKAARTGP